MTAAQQCVSLSVGQNALLPQPASTPHPGAVLAAAVQACSEDQTRLAPPPIELRPPSLPVMMLGSIGMDSAVASASAATGIGAALDTSTSASGQSSVDAKRPLDALACTRASTTPPVGASYARRGSAHPCEKESGTS